MSSLLQPYFDLSTENNTNNSHLCILSHIPPTLKCKKSQIKPNRQIKTPNSDCFPAFDHRWELILDTDEPQSEQKLRKQSLKLPTTELRLINTD